MPVKRLTVELETPTGDRISFKCNDTRLSKDRNKLHVYGGSLSVNGNRINRAKVSGTATNPNPNNRPGQRLPVKRIKYALAHALAVHLGFDEAGASKKVADLFPIQDHRDIIKARNHRSIKPFDIRLIDYEISIVAVLTMGVEAGQKYEWLGLRYDKEKSWPDDGLSVVSLVISTED